MAIYPLERETSASRKIEARSQATTSNKGVQSDYRALSEISRDIRANWRISYEIASSVDQLPARYVC